MHTCKHTVLIYIFHIFCFLDVCLCVLLFICQLFRFLIPAANFAVNTVNIVDIYCILWIVQFVLFVLYWGTVAQCGALLPHSKKVVGSSPAWCNIQVTGYSFGRRFYPKRLTSSAYNQDIGSILLIS